MKVHLAEFLDHLRLNENASAHTVRAYDSDLSQFITFVAAHLNRRRPDLAASDFNHLNIRAFLGDLHKRGNSRSSAARKLAAIRTFGKYLRWEGAIAGDTAGLVGTPKREDSLPASRRRWSARPSAKNVSRRTSGSQKCRGCSKCPTRPLRSAVETVRFSSSF